MMMSLPCNVRSLLLTFTTASEAGKVGPSAVKWDGLAYGWLFSSPSNSDRFRWRVAV